MNINIATRCSTMQESNIIKELQLGATKIKFSNSYIVKTKEERENNIRNFKQAYMNLYEVKGEKNK